MSGSFWKAIESTAFYTTNCDEDWGLRLGGLNVRNHEKDWTGHFCLEWEEWEMNESNALSSLTSLKHPSRSSGCPLSVILTSLLDQLFLVCLLFLHECCLNWKLHSLDFLFSIKLDILTEKKQRKFKEQY